MTRTKKIAIIVVLIILFLVGYFIVIQQTERVEAPSGFRGPNEPPSVQGPSGPPPGN